MFNFNVLTSKWLKNNTFLCTEFNISSFINRSVWSGPWYILWLKLSWLFAETYFQIELFFKCAMNNIGSTMWCMKSNDSISSKTQTKIIRIGECGLFHLFVKTIWISFFSCCKWWNLFTFWRDNASPIHLFLVLNFTLFIRWCRTRDMIIKVIVDICLLSKAYKASLQIYATALDMALDISTANTKG